MSTQIVTVDVDFSTENADDCGYRLIEVPSDTVEAGDELEFRLNGSLEDIDGFTLTAGTVSLGVGTVHSILPPADVAAIGDPLNAVSQQIDFSATVSGQFDYPIEHLIRVVALTEILALDADGIPYRIAAQGSICTELFRRKGGSCIQAKDTGTLLYGSVKATALRVPYYRRWTWTVPAATYGDQWFFLYYLGDVYKKFSVALPELATATGTANITIRPMDESSEEVIAGAAVYLDGVMMGTTTNLGLKLNGVNAGTHVLKITAPGYLDTDSDELSNDTIVVG